MATDQLTGLDALVTSVHEDLHAALEQMTANRKGVLFVCGDEGRLVGVISDGDVRRLLLHETVLSVPLAKIMNTNPLQAATVDEARALLARSGAIAVPVVDPEGRLRAAVVSHQGDVVVLTGPQPPAAGGATTATVPAVVPARGGSKRIPGKNLATVAGRPLLAWTIEAAKRARHVDRVIVSTDDDEIAEVARAAGAEVPFLRPAELAHDTAATFPVVAHALSWWRDATGAYPEIAVLLEPTAILRRSETIDRAIEVVREQGVDSAIGVAPLPHVLHPDEVLAVEGDILRPFPHGATWAGRRLRGQQQPAYAITGDVYAFRVERCLEAGSLFGDRCAPVITPWEEFLDVDEPWDLVRAERALLDRRDDA